MIPIQTASVRSFAASVADDGLTANSVGRGRKIRTLQVGMSRFADRPGGLERYFEELLQHLPEVGVESRGLVMGPAAAGSDAVGSVTAVADARAKLWNRWGAMRKHVAAELSGGNLDLMVAHHALYSFPVIRMIRDVPLVVHFQGPWARESRQEGGGKLACSAKAFVERMVYRRANRLIVLCSAFKDILINQYGVPADRIHVIPGGVECGRFRISETRAEAREKLGWPTDRPIVLAVRRLAKRMGLENLIEAAEVIRRDLPDVLILIAGGGSQRETLLAAIHQRGLGETVRLLGYVPDAELPLAFRAADLGVVPTLALEGFGLVAAESLAAGTPVMATPVDGLVDLVGPLAENLLLKGSTVADIATGLSAALKEQLDLPDAAACAAYARRRFDWSVIAARVADVYREAIEAK